MAADHHIQQHQAHQHHSSQQPTASSSTATITREDSLERLFPRCRVRSPPVDTAVLIDLSDDNVVQTSAALPLHSFSRPTAMTHPDGGPSDSDASPLRRPPSLKLNIAAGQPQQRRYCPSVKYRTESAELRRSKFLRRPRTLDHNTWSLYGDVYAGGYEPSSDSEDNDSDHFGFPSSGKSGNVAPAPSSSGSSSSLRKSNPPAAVRTSASESHIVGRWKKGGHNGHHAEAAGHQRHPRRRGVKEIYDLTPTLSAGSASGGVGASGSIAQLDPTRMEIAGGREIVSLSRSRTRGSQRKQPRVQSMVDPAPMDSPPHNKNNNNNNNSTPSSSSNRSMNRYSGEVYYEESVGRYGFHVGGGNTLWGSQGLEPSFSIASHLNEKQYPSSGNAVPAGMADGTAVKSDQPCAQHHGLKRPLSWAGDDPSPDRQSAEQHPQREAQELASASSQDREGPSSDRETKPPVALSNGPSSGMEDAASSQMQAVHGYLTDFYPEVVAAELNSADPSSSSPLNLDNYLSEQLNQFAQQKCVRREASEAEEASQQLLSQSPPVQQQQLTVATVIGGLTIAQYEGSPRRYGVRAHPATAVATPVNANGQDEYSDDCGKPANGPIVGLPPARPLVPGFPRRITTSPNPAHPQATFSPSATRQTLVDLAAGPAATSTPVAATPEGLSANHLSWHLEDVADRGFRSSGGQDQHGDAISLNAETDLGETEVGLQMGKSRNFTLSPETTDYDDSELDIYNGAELSATDMPAMNGTQTSGSCHMDSFDGVGADNASRRRNSSKSQNGLKGQFSSMPILEDGLSSGRSSADEDISVASSASITSASDTEEDAVMDRIPLMSDRRMKQLSAQHPLHSVNNGCRNLAGASPLQSSINAALSGARSTKHSSSSSTTLAPAATHPQQHPAQQAMWSKKMSSALSDCDHHNHQEAGIIQGSFRARNATPPPPAPLAHRPPSSTTQQHAVQTAASTSPTVNNGVKSFAAASAVASVGAQSRANNHASPLRLSPGPDTPSVTSGGAGGRSSGSSSNSSSSSSSSSCSSGVGSSAGKMQNVGNQQPKMVGPSGDLSLHELGDALDHGRMRKASSVPPPAAVAALQSPLSRSPPVWVPRQSSDYWAKNSPSSTSPRSRCKVGGTGMHPDGSKLNDDDDERETDQLLRDPDDQGFFDEHDDNSSQSKKKGRSKEVMVHEPAVLIEGVLFRANYLGSTQIVCEGQPTKYTRMMQAEEAVSRIKAPEGETQPTTEVDLFISTEKIMVLNTELKEIMMDHALRTISYIADIGDLVVLMARRRMITQDGEDSSNKIAKTPKMVCHVFESEEAQFIAQSIGQAFQVAYMEFLKANGIEDQSFVREMDYQEVLNSQEIFGDELQMFAKKELQKEVIVPKARNEILGVVIVESGWGSMLPTVVIANLAPAGAAARCGQLNIGDQIIAINGISLVGLPLSTCQTYIKNAKSATVVKLTVVPCPPVVEVKIKRPDTKYQLGFSVQNGVICSLLRGGIAERGGVRVGHRIIEINGQSVVAVPHERIVGLLATSVGEINMKTMPTSMFRLLIGQETPVYI